MPLDVDFESLRYRGASRERCYELFSKLAFRSLVNDYAPTADTIQKDYRAGRVAQRSSTRWWPTLRAAGEFALRVIPDQPSAMRAAIVGIAFSTADRAGAVRPARPRGAVGTAATCSPAPTLPRRWIGATALDRLKPLLEDESVRKIGHDLKFDASSWRAHGIALRGLAFDSMLASYLLDATRSGHPLEETSLEHLGYKALTEEDVCGRGAKALPLAQVSPETLLNFAGERATSRGSWRTTLAPLLVRHDARARCIASSRCRSCRCSPTSNEAGVRIDGPALAAQSQRIEQELARLTRADLRAGGTGVQRQLAEAARRDPVRQAAAAGAEEDRQDAIGVHGRRGARGAGARRTSCRG